jgi:hypothetical protein
MAGEYQLCPSAPDSLLIHADTAAAAVAHPGHPPAVHIEIVRSGQHQLVTRSAKGAALHGAAVVVAGMVKLAHVDRALQVVENGRQAATDAQQLGAGTVKPTKRCAVLQSRILLMLLRLQQEKLMLFRLGQGKMMRFGLRQGKIMRFRLR